MKLETLDTRTRSSGFEGLRSLLRRGREAEAFDHFCHHDIADLAPLCYRELLACRALWRGAEERAPSELKADIEALLTADARGEEALAALWRHASSALRGELSRLERARLGRARAQLREPVTELARSSPALFIAAASLLAIQAQRAPRQVFFDLVGVPDTSTHPGDPEPDSARPSPARRHAT